MVRYWVLHSVMLAGIYKLFGFKGLMFQLNFAFQGAFWLETINFLEHYGIRRFKDENEIFESIGYQHSWNSVSSPFAFRL